MIQKNKTSPLVLVVDDDKVMLMTLEEKVKQQKCRVLTATNGKEACEILTNTNEPINAILLDRMMPVMDGMEVIEWLGKQTNIEKPPIIMVTGADSPEQIKEGIDAGVFYYLTKPVQTQVLKSVLASAVEESIQQHALKNELKRHRISFKLMEKGLFYIQTLEEAENISCFLANCFPDSEKALPAIAELVINALEHGNLGITYDEKTTLIQNGTWRQEVAHRTNLPQNKDKKIKLLFEKKGSEYLLKILDQGTGFEWSKFLKVNPARATDNHGTGIARANMIFSKLLYSDKGNQVTAIIDTKNEKNINW
ncbi:MAG: histidine kinase [Rickettsiales bacterium]|nr:MAG: histidine kinase [Rickettsiales bacterium]